MGFPFVKQSFNFPVTSQIGSSFNNIVKISSDKNIDKKYKTKFFRTKAISRILDVPRRLEGKYYDKKITTVTIDKSPIFIIGFWRGGTTVLHNLLCQDTDSGYVSTFQGVFPNDCFINQWWIRNIAKFFLPEKRPGGDMIFDFKLPQEEEIALGNMQHISFYNFFYFPNDIDVFIRNSLFFKDISRKDMEQWKQNYIKLVKTALVNTNGTRFISKNPPNTFRIKLLLELFPDAKFIYIHRNIYQTIYSFQKFVNAVHSGIKYQDYNVESHNLKLIKLYKMMIEQYNIDKHQIPKHNLVEIKFEKFEKNMLSEIKRIYGELDLPGYDKAKPAIEGYYNKISSYKRQPQQPSSVFMNQVNEIMDP